MLRVMIVEDDPVFLNRFCNVVASEPEFELFAAVRNGAAALDSLARGAPDVLLIDLGLPDISGIEIIRETVQRYPDTDIMVVSVFGDEEHVLASIAAGATGYILKDSLPEEARGSHQAVARGRLAHQSDHCAPAAEEAAPGKQRVAANRARPSGIVGAGV